MCRSKPTLCDRAFEHAAPQLWNALSLGIRKACSVDVFKSLLKTSPFCEGFILIYLDWGIQSFIRPSEVFHVCFEAACGNCFKCSIYICFFLQFNYIFKLIVMFCITLNII